MGGPPGDSYRDVVGARGGGGKGEMALGVMPREVLAESKPSGQPPRLRQSPLMTTAPGMLTSAAYLLNAARIFDTLAP